MYDSMLGKASFLLHTVLLEYFAGEKPLRISNKLILCDCANYCVLARIVCIYNHFRFCDLLLQIDQPSQNLHMLIKHSSNTVTVRSVVIMVVGLQVWGYGRQQGSSEEGYTQ